MRAMIRTWLSWSGDRLICKHLRACGVAALSVVLLPARALAQGGNLQPVQSTLQQLIQVLTGPIATSLAILAVIALGMLAWVGRLTWYLAGSINLDAFATLLRGRLKSGDEDLSARLDPWRKADQRGWLFNNPVDRFRWRESDRSHGVAGADNHPLIIGFDMTRVLDDPAIRTAALLYIFHRIDELLTGAPTIIFLDEGWRLLDDPVFALFIKDKLKTIRKQNGIVGFGTQSAADIVRSSSANTLIEQSATNIFFPNPKADAASYGEAFRLSDREIAWIRETGPELRSFLIRHGRDSVIARLNLNGMPDLIKVLSGRTETVAEMERLRAELGNDPAAWLPAFMGHGPHDQREARHATHPA